MRLTLGSAIQAAKGWLARRRTRARALSEGLDTLSGLLKLANFRTRHFSRIVEEITQLFFVADQHFPDALDQVLIRLLSGLAQWFSKRAFYTVALLTPASGADCVPRNLRLKFRVAVNRSHAAGENLEVTSQDPAGIAYTTGIIQYAPDKSGGRACKSDPLTAHEHLTLLDIPLFLEGQVVAVLSIDGNEEDCLSHDDKEVALFAGRLAEVCLALERLRRPAAERR